MGSHPVLELIICVRRDRTSKAIVDYRFLSVIFHLKLQHRLIMSALVPEKPEAIISYSRVTISSASEYWCVQFFLTNFKAIHQSLRCSDQIDCNGEYKL